MTNKTRGLEPCCRPLQRGIFLIFAAVSLPGCQAGYLLQQGLGQWRQGCAQVALDDPELEVSLTPAQREKLRWVPRILEFARDDLGLEPGDSYQTFLDTGGKPVSHSVTAAHPFALIAYRWCFPFIGCVTYKGYFDPEDARSEGERLQAEGWDVAVQPVAAYSTLGWFRDPVLSTMLDLELPGLVELILHETTHRTLYAPGATDFNESLATHVARAGTRIFLELHPPEAGEEVVARYLRDLRALDQRDDLLGRLQKDVEALYHSDSPPSEKARRKKEIFSTAAAAAERLGLSRHSVPSTNAHLLAGARYRRFLPALARLEEKAGGHPRKLMTYLQELFAKEGGLPEEIFDE